MDKNTLSTYGWVIVTVIILAALLAFLPMFNDRVSSETIAIPDNLVNRFFGDVPDEPAHIHNHTSHIVQQPTCALAGVIKYNCECGSEYTEPIKKTEHTCGPAATCTTAQICTECGDIITAALGHTPGAKATCTTAQTCAVCGEILANALEHNPSSEWQYNGGAHWQVCTNNCGIADLNYAAHVPNIAFATEFEDKYCIVCNYIIESTSGHTHAYYSSTISAASCSSAGTLKYTCSCGDYYYSTTGKLDHTPGSAATCTNAQICTVCGEIIVGALGHETISYSGKEPTCTTSGWYAYEECSRCGYSTYSSRSATGHIPGASATCTAAQKCTVCGEVLESALEHAYGSAYFSSNGNGTHTACRKCSNCDHVKEGATTSCSTSQEATCTQGANCSKCGYTVTPATGHTSVYGGTVSCHTKCDDCGVTISSSSGHSYTQSVIQEATCTVSSVVQFSCECGYSYTRTGSTNSNNHINVEEAGRSMGVPILIYMECKDCGHGWYE